MWRRVAALLICGIAAAAPAAARPKERPKTMPVLKLHAQNPHYFEFDGKPVLLVTSGEHYGAVLNRAFDYAKYLDTLQADGLNLTRLFTGAYVEHHGAFDIVANTLAPAPGDFICPWQRTDTPGYRGGGNRFGGGGSRNGGGGGGGGGFSRGKRREPRW